MIQLTMVMALLFSANAFAQIPNNGFEQTDSNGNIRNWGNTFLLPIWADSTGKPDSVKLDSAFYFGTTDTYTGLRAIEMRNMYNFTRQIGIAGSISVSPDGTVYTGFAGSLPITQTPETFSFYYKYFPVNGDSAIATLKVFDEAFLEIGEAILKIGGTWSNYTLANATVTYTQPSTPSFMSIRFSTSTYIQQPNYGTRLLIDDVSVTSKATGVNNISEEQSVLIFPNPANEVINVLSAGEIYTYSIHNIFGQTISVGNLNQNESIDICTLPKGNYFIQFNSDKSRKTLKFIKQ